MTKLVWTEIWVNDLEAAFAFYQDLFAWRFEAFVDYADNYFIARSPQGKDPDVALVHQKDVSASAMKTSIPYFLVESLESSLAKVGSPETPVTYLPHGGGSFCMIQDPSGNWIGLWCNPPMA